MTVIPDTESIRVQCSIRNLFDKGTSPVEKILIQDQDDRACFEIASLRQISCRTTKLNTSREKH